MKKLLLRKAVYIAFISALLLFSGLSEKVPAYVMALLFSVTPLIVFISVLRFRFVEKKSAELYALQEKTVLTREQIEKLPNFLAGDDFAIEEVILFLFGVVICVFVGIKADDWFRVGHTDLGFIPGIIAGCLLVWITSFTSYISLSTYCTEKYYLNNYFFNSLFGEAYIEAATAKGFAFYESRDLYVVYPRNRKDEQREEEINRLFVDFVKQKKEEIENYKSPWQDIIDKVKEQTA